MKSVHFEELKTKINNKLEDGETLITWIEAEVFVDEVC